MLELGKSLREAREAAGLTVSQLAERTRLLTQVIESLESENFARFAAPIYGRGFIKLYCSTVGLDPDPFINEYMAIINGERETPIVRKKSGLSPAAEPSAGAVEVPEPVPVVRPEPKVFEKAEPSRSESISTNVPPPEEEPFRLEGERTTAFSRYSSPLYDPKPARRGFRLPCSLPKISTRIVRLALLAAVAAGIAVALFFGISKLYRATMSGATGETGDEARVTERPAPAQAPDAAPIRAVPRKYVKVKPLYVD